MVKREMEKVKNKIKLVLMSATMDTELIKDFFIPIKEVSKK
jgi:HrpA-like RNA helicase